MSGTPSKTPSQTLKQYSTTGASPKGTPKPKRAIVASSTLHMASGHHSGKVSSSGLGPVGRQTYVLECRNLTKSHDYVYVSECLRKGGPAYMHDVNGFFLYFGNSGQAAVRHCLYATLHHPGKTILGGRGNLAGRLT